jgi:hypothetical protein
MPRLADPTGSRLVMVGVNQYLDIEIWPNLPAVTANIRDLRSILVKKSYWGIPEQNCQVISDPSEPGPVLEAILHASRLATDTVVVYYAGHGAATLEGLILTLSSTTVDNLQWRGIHFSSIRGIIHERRAKNAVIVLDCCFSGLAHSMSDLEPYIASQIAETSAFMLTSSARDAASLAPPNEPYTAFTGELLKALRDGDDECGEFMSLGAVARKVANQLASLGRPIPKFSQTGSGDDLSIVRNAKYSKPRADPAAVSPEGLLISREGSRQPPPSDRRYARESREPEISGRHAQWIRKSFTVDIDEHGPDRSAHSWPLPLLTRTSSPTQVTTVVARTLNEYLSWRNEDGGWPMTVGSPTSSSWSTAQALYLLTELDREEFYEEILGAVQWLVGHRNYDRAWGLEAGVSDVVGTELAIYAMAPYANDGYAAVLKESAEWLAARQNPQDSGWAYVPRNTISSVFCTAWGIASLVALGKALHDPVLKKVYGQRGKRFLVNAQSKDPRDPGWGKFEGSPTEGMRTAHALFGLVAADAGRGRVARQGVLALRKEQEPDGGWGDDDGSNVEGTVWAVAAMLLVGEPVLDRSLGRGVDFLLATWNSEVRGWPERAGEDVEVWCTHHGLVALTRYLAALACVERSPRRMLPSRPRSRRREV